MSFEGCWAKVAWAKKHRDTLESLVTQTFSGHQNLASVGLRFDPESGDHVAYVTYVPDLARFFLTAGLLVGDTVHNLRAALDHVAYESAMQRTQGKIKNPRALEWPISERREQWIAARKRSLREVLPEHRAIIERYQHHKRIAEIPEGGTDGLVLLADLDNTDKHRILLPVLHPTAGITDPDPSLAAVFMLQALTQLNSPEPWEYRRVELGTEVARFRLPIVLAPVEMAGYVAPIICLSKPFPEIPLVDLMSQLIQLIVKIVSEFTPVPEDWQSVSYGTPAD